jgi:hypothetical protein
VQGSYSIHGDSGRRRDSSNVLTITFRQHNYMPMPERRKSPRTRMILPVKVLIGDTSLLAHTVDISHSGARIGGIRAQLQLGMMVELQRGPRKARFVIRWIQELNPTEVRIGIESQEPQDKFWGVGLTNENNSAKRTDALLTLFSSASGR